MNSKFDLKPEKKSLKERFFLVIGGAFFLAYFVFGLLFIFWDKIPINMKPNYRIAFGVVLVVYAFVRFYRIIKDNKA
jgi:uncharacterized membrane protein (DUF485 family)